jgi:hypothetical protein
MHLIQTNWLIGISSILLYPYILVIRLDKVIINHAFIHVMQIRRSQRKYGKTKGVIFWYFSYLWEWVKVGLNYWKIKYELEAFGNEENEAYIVLRDPELWQQIRHNFDNLQN